MKNKLAVIKTSDSLEVLKYIPCFTFQSSYVFHIHYMSLHSPGNQTADAPVTPALNMSPVLCLPDPNPNLPTYQ